MSVTALTDAQRLDAISEHGLCVATHDALKEGQWQRTWVVCYGVTVMLAPTIREAIDAAVFDLVARNPSERMQ